jgi:hypothetical protein
MSAQEVTNKVAELKAQVLALYAAMNVSLSSLTTVAAQAAASAEQARLDAIRAESGGGSSGAPTAFPTSRTITGEIGKTVNALICGFRNCTPTGVVSGTAPAGTTISLANGEVRLVGTYTTIQASTTSTLVFSTDKGNVTFSLSTNVTAAVIGDTRGLLHLTEGSYPSRPTSVTNYISGGIPYANRSANGAPGGNYWFGGEGPFGSALNMDSANNGPCGLIALEKTTVPVKFCHEGFMANRAVGESWCCFSTNGQNLSDTPTYVNLKIEDMGNSLYRFRLTVKLSAGAAPVDAIVSSTFALDGVAPGFNHLMFNRDAQGYFRVAVNGRLVGTSSVAYPTVSTDVYFDMHGREDRVTGDVQGTYRALVSEFRLKFNDPVYTTFPFTPPADRFTAS